MSAIPKLSIVMPVYKRRRWLREAIWSIIGQTFTDWELIVVDDGSKDIALTMEVYAASAGDGRVRLATVSENLGKGVSCGPALNVGFKIARGEYLAWATDDNVWFPDCYRRLVAALDVGADFAYGMTIIHESDAVASSPFDRETFSAFCHCGIAFAYRRAVLEKIGDYGNRWDQDFVYWKAVQSAGFRIVSLDVPPLASYRNHRGTVTQRVQRGELPESA